MGRKNKDGLLSGDDNDDFNDEEAKIDTQQSKCLFAFGFRPSLLIKQMLT